MYWMLHCLNYGACGFWMTPAGQSCTYIWMKRNYRLNSMIQGGKQLSLPIIAQEQKVWLRIFHDTHVPNRKTTAERKIGRNSHTSLDIYKLDQSKHLQKSIKLSPTYVIIGLSTNQSDLMVSGNPDMGTHLIKMWTLKTTNQNNQITK